MSRRKQARPRSFKSEESWEVAEETAENGDEEHVMTEDNENVLTTEVENENDLDETALEISDEPSTEVEFSLSDKGNLILIYGGNRFRKKNRYKNNSYWSCIDESCDVRLILNEEAERIVKRPIVHNHEPCHVLNFVSNTKHLMKKTAALDPQRDLRDIYDSILAKARNAVSLGTKKFSLVDFEAMMPPFADCLKYLGRKRDESNVSKDYCESTIESLLSEGVKDHDQSASLQNNNLDHDSLSGNSKESVDENSAQLAASEENRSTVSPVLLQCFDETEYFPYTIGASDDYPYLCQSCNKSFLKRGHLQKHEQVHSDEWEYSCTYCAKKFRHKRSRDRHVRQHTGDKKYKCPKCEAAFSRSDHLKVHFRTHDQFKPYKCTLCNRSYSTPISLTVHVSQHNDKKSTRVDMYRCGFCRATFSEMKDLQHHIITDHRGGSLLIDYLSDDKDGIKKEDDISTDPADWRECSRCSSVFATELELEDHQAVCDLQLKSPNEVRADHVTSDDAKTLSPAAIIKVENEVDICAEQPVSSTDTSTMNTDQLSIVKQSYLATSMHVCPYCYVSDFATLELLEIHMQSVHSAKPRDIYRCNYCNAPYQNLYSLHEHMRVVHKNEPSFDIKYPCSCCGACFSSLEELAIHKEEAHSHIVQKSPILTKTLLTKGPSSLLNKYCASYLIGQDSSLDAYPASKRLKLAKDSMDLEKEKYSGSNEKGDVLKSETCFRCNKTFDDSAQYVFHMRQHFNEKLSKNLNNDEPYTGEHKCPQCGKGFMSEALVEAHAYSHFLVLSQKYSCDTCGKSFSKPDELQKHLMDLHAHHLYQCTLCKEIFDSKVNIQVHFAVKHSDECKAYKCVECCITYTNEDQFRLHVQMSHLNADRKNIRCLFCSQTFTNDFDLQCHITTHQKSFHCTMCSESFHVEFLLDKHINEVHSSDVDVAKVNSTGISSNEVKKEVTALNSHDHVFLCNICDDAFADMASLHKHKVSTHGQMHMQPVADFDQFFTQYEATELPTPVSGEHTVQDSCTFCSQTFKSAAEMEKHMRIHVNSDGQKCIICDEVFLSASDLAEHKLQHCKISQGNTCLECKTTLENEDEFYIHSQDHGYQGKVMQCVICCQTLATISEMHIHGKYHFKSTHQKHICCVCLKKFESPDNLVSRQTSSGKLYYICKPCFHDDQTLYTCSDCPLTFRSHERYLSHQVSHRKSFQCIKCQETFNSEYEIKLHVASHVIQEGNSNLCNLCNETFDSPARLQQHLIEHTFESGRIVCHVCGMLFTTSALIQTHALTHGFSGRKYKCQHCTLSFFFSAELSNHIVSEHTSFLSSIQAVTPKSSSKKSISRKSGGTAKNNEDCDVCHKRFATLSALISHRKIHDRVDCDDLTCSLCQETFNNITELQQHTMSSHKDNDTGIRVEGQMFQCPHCDKEFPKLSSLQGHSHIHKTVGKKFSCPLCRKVFTLASNLKIHLQCHTSDKPHECHICKKSFSRKENMQAHVQSHSGVKPFSCIVCNKTFARSNYLKDHMRVHFAQDPTNPLLSQRFTGNTLDDDLPPLELSPPASTSNNDDSLALIQNGRPVFPDTGVPLSELPSD